MKVLVAQLGARRHYAVPRALAAHNVLYACVTDLCADAPPLSWLRVTPRLLRPAPIQRALDRRAPGVPAANIHNLTLFALDPRHRRRRGEHQAAYWARRNAAFGRAVCARGFGGADAIYGYNGAALEIFSAAKKLGILCILDQTAAPWRYNSTLLKEQTRLWPKWEVCPSEIDESEVLCEREEAEWRLADIIICGSHFAADALAASGGPSEKCAVVSYGGHVVAGPCHALNRVEPPHLGPKLRVLTVGTLQLRKGAPYLLDAARRSSAFCEFRWVGKNLLSPAATIAMREHVELIGPTPRSALAQQFAWADVFVLPTLSEGSANVVYEAMAAGLPVVTTPNSGSIIEPGVTGILVQARDSEGLTNALRGLADAADERRRLATAAHRQLRKTTIADYGAALARHISRS